MHVRWSLAYRMPVVDDESQTLIGLLTSPLIDCDTGRILGFFVDGGGWGSDGGFLSTLDIIAWGTKVHVRSADKIAPPDELIRMKSYFQDPRAFLGQRIRIKGSAKKIGTCADIQFDTRHFAIEWMFPRGWFFFGQPIPASEIAEVTSGAIWIFDPLKPAKKEEAVMKVERAGTTVMPDIATTI